MIRGDDGRPVRYGKIDPGAIRGARYNLMARGNRYEAFFVGDAERLPGCPTLREEIRHAQKFSRVDLGVTRAVDAWPSRHYFISAPMNRPFFSILTAALLFLAGGRLPVRAATDGDATFSLRINCGATAAWTDPAGHRWEADREYEKGGWGAVDGDTAGRGDIEIEGTDLEPVYRTERSDLSEYRITCPSGKYRVTFHFAETYSENKEPGKRVFSVAINNREVMADMDPVKAAGGQFKAVQKTFATEVADGLLSIAFTGIVTTPEINGIEIIQTDALAPPDPVHRIVGWSAKTPGFCVAVGCGRASSPGLAAELAAASNWLVHGLAADDAALERARQAIGRRDVAGRAMVEKLAGKALPYASNLANVVVVEDFAALANKGLTADEALRVAVPGGVVWLERDGRWERTVKPWPAPMDEWTHPHHGPDGNRVSGDGVLQFPASLRWQGGLPVAVAGATRGVVAAGGRVFALGPNVLENVLPFRRTTGNEYLTARDLFNGTELWKVRVDTAKEWIGMSPYNAAALVTDGKAVYLGDKNRLLALAADSGASIREYAVNYPVAKLLLADGVLVAAGWPEKKASQEKDLWLLKQVSWAPMVSGGDRGSLQAFDAAGGAEKWAKDLAVQEALCSGGRLFILCQEGNPATSQSILALDLATGAEKWRTADDAFAPERGSHLGLAGAEVLAVVRLRAKKTSVLSAETGQLLWEKPGVVPRLVGGRLWIDGVQYDPLTGEGQGTVAEFGNGWMCTPSSLVGSYLLQGRANGYFKLSDDYSKVVLQDHHSSNRGGCLEGYIIAGGMLLSAENNCACQTGQMPGFFALGAADAVPQKGDYEARRPIEQGPAYGSTGKAPQKAAGDEWPMFLGNAERSSCSPGPCPRQLKLLWQTAAVAAPAGPGAAAWEEQSTSRMTAPVAADGKVLVADVHRGTLVALDAASGKIAWKTATGGRIDGPPALWNGRCVFGSHDGWVYALRTRDGALVWKTRAAPLDQRMISFGAVESPWPAVGPVTIANDVLFVSAGRATETDGGLAILALDPASGKQIWATRAETSPGFQNDLLRLDNGKLLLHTLRLDPVTGAGEITDKKPPRNGLDGWQGGTWKRIPARRSGGLAFGAVTGELLAWDAKTLYGFSLKTKCLFALPREKALAANPPGKADYSWQIPQRKVQPEALVRAANALIAAGTVMDYDMSSPPKGMLWLTSAETGERMAELPLSASPAYGGLALAKGRIYVSLEDGTVVCAGAEKQIPEEGSLGIYRGTIPR